MNQLAHETSPYLLQHADNPVDWHAWNDEALQKARDKDKPILLSIGYSACHWCHVMAHESFESDEIAALMNRYFVNIKVDREERPDIDRIYQTAHQLLAQRSGGWPLTVFLTPQDHLPFFAGTYFPVVARHGLPGFSEILERVAVYYREHRNDVDTQCMALTTVFERMSQIEPVTEDVLNRAPLDAIRASLESSFDSRYGGFGPAPKFPHATGMDRLLRHWRSTADSARPDTQALFMVTLSMQRMAQGGLYDQLGGGFFRYSVDPYWMIPHFEKMLYDNGPLLALYAQTGRATGDEFYLDIARETANWVMRRMQSPDGGYYSTLDADSDGEEGRFYVWTPEQVSKVLNDGDLAVFTRCYGLDRDANFEGHWHLHLYEGMSDVAKELKLTPDEAKHHLDSARARLLEARHKRLRPGRDEKILTSWNGLMIRGMAIAGRELAEPAFIDSAMRAVDFIRTSLLVDDRLLAAFKNGRARFMAYLDDYVFLADGLVELLQARWRTSDLVLAKTLCDLVLEHFEDRDHGGFLFTADDHETLIHRPRPLGDDSMPSGNAIAALVLGRLGWLLGETRYLDAAKRCLQAGWNELLHYPQAHASMLTALEEYLEPGDVVIIRGSGDELHEWHRLAGIVYNPSRQVYAIDRDTDNLPDVLAAKTMIDGTTAYICAGNTCSEPITDIATFASALKNSGPT